MRQTARNADILMKQIILLVAFCAAVPLCAQQPPPVGSCSGPSQVGNTASTPNAGGQGSSTYICATVGQGPVRYVWQIVQTPPSGYSVPANSSVVGTDSQGRLIPGNAQLPTYAQAGGTGSPNTQACIAGYPVVQYTASGQTQIYTCGATTANQYGIAPAGLIAANSIACNPTGSTAAIQACSGAVGVSSNGTYLKYRPNVVTDYSADNTGAASSQAQFGNAITAIVAAGGGELYVPCGTYTWSGTVTVSSTLVSIRGENQSCVTINYTGSGTALYFYSNPFTIVPLGELSGFTLVGTSSGQTGVYSGTTGGYLHDFTVKNFTAGDGIDLVDDANNSNNWTERNSYHRVQTANDLVGWHLKRINSTTTTSFGYNDFTGNYANADNGQTGFWLDTASSFLYNGKFNFSCNLSQNNGTTLNVICVRVTGTVGGETEFNVTGEITSGSNVNNKVYSLYVDAGGSLSATGTNTIQTALTYCGATANVVSVCRLAPNPQSWDVGGTTTWTDPNSGSITGTLQPYTQSNLYGWGGVTGTNVGSVYGAISNYAGNEVLFGTVPSTGGPLNVFSPKWQMDTSGNTTQTGWMSAALRLPARVLGTAGTLVSTDGIIFLSGNSLTLPSLSPLTNYGPFILINNGGSPATITVSGGGPFPTSIPAGTTYWATYYGGWYKAN